MKYLGRGANRQALGEDFLASTGSVLLGDWGWPYECPTLVSLIHPRMYCIREVGFHEVLTTPNPTYSYLYLLLVILLD